MLPVVIIEDDFASSELLSDVLNETEMDIEVVAVVRSVKEGIDFFKSRRHVNLIFSDIQLADGLSFQIFEEVSFNAPIIFVSAFDEYLVSAFEYGGIDYLLKPVTKQGIQHALSKYKSLQKHFLENNSIIKKFLDDYLTTKKTRIVVKKGTSNISLLLSDVVFFYTENMVVYVYDNKGVKYLIDKSLNSLETELDNKIFFRANRQYLLNVNYVQGYKNYERVKLLVILTAKEIDHTIIIGQEKAKSFRHWLAEG